MAHPQLTTHLKQLRLSGMLETLDVRLRQAGEDRWSHSDFLQRLLHDEAERRGQNQLATRIRRANIRADKTIEQFDFSFNPQINRPLLLELATCQFVARKVPVIIVGPTGTGKTHLAQALAHEACVKGYNTLYSSTAGMLAMLTLARAEGTYARKLKSLTRPALLVLDDFGLKHLHASDPEHFYDVISERYESGATLITSNRALDEWPQLFGDPLLASSGLDRLFHNAYIVTITGASFRARNRNAAISSPASKAAKVAINRDQEATMA
jgi:DNA replication protein DnaC